MQMNTEKYSNPVALTVQALGGQSRFSKLLASRGVIVHRQTVFNWCVQGKIPHQYGKILAVIVKTYPHIREIAGDVLACIRPEGSLNGTVVAPNVALEEFVKNNGGITAMLDRVNAIIREQNKIEEHDFILACRRAALAREAPPIDTRTKKWTYVMIHNWLKRGRVSDNFQRMFSQIFDCPIETMEMQKNVITENDILGET